MAKATLDSRVEELEGCVCELKDGLKAVADEVHEIDKYLHNGFGDRLGEKVKAALVAHQAELWQREREERELRIKEKELADREYGRARDRKMQVMLGLIGAAAVIIPPVITLILSRIWGQ